MIIFLLCGVFSSCELKTSEDSLPESVGKYGQILVVIDTAYESGPVGDFITELLVSPMYGLPQAEGKFNVSTVPHAGFKDILKRATNIIVIKIRRGEESKFLISANKWAKGQTVLNISGSSVKNVMTILEQNAEAILDLFKQKELDRRKAHLKQFPNTSLVALMKEKYSLSMSVSSDFEIIDSSDTGFWMKSEKMVGGHQVIQGIIVNLQPYTSSDIFSSEEMLLSRDELTKGYITGMGEGSFMKVFSEYPLKADTAKVNGLYAVEYRGLWNMKNDFMGGPFLHYTVLDEKNNRIIQLDGFVYAPKFKKRGYIKELEAILTTIQVVEKKDQ